MEDWKTLTMGGPVGPKMPTATWNGLAIVGEVPGIQEVAHGEVMTGPTGRVLDKMMVSAGLVREETLMTNVFRMLPIWTVDDEGKRRQDTSVFFTDNPAIANDRLPPYRQRRVMKGPDEDVRALWRLLRREQPKLIVALGACALWALTGEESIGQSVGGYFDTGAATCKVMATWNPAYALHRNDEDIAVQVANHLRKAAQYVETERMAEAGSEEPF